MELSPLFLHLSWVAVIFFFMGLLKMTLTSTKNLVPLVIENLFSGIGFVGIVPVSTAFCIVVR
jgi:hypothetical protein